jgi:hypothetical protein
MEETYHNTKNSDRNYGKKREPLALEKFCKEKSLSYIQSSHDDDTKNKFDAYINDYPTSVKCSERWPNGSFPKKDLIPENKSVYVLFENNVYENYLVWFESLKEFINEGKAVDRGAYYVIDQKDLYDLQELTKKLHPII